MAEEKIVFQRPAALADLPTHYCPGCTHGIIHRLVAEVEALYCPNIRGGVQYAVAEAYQHWYDVSEDEAKRLLDDFAASH